MSNEVKNYNGVLENSFKKETIRYIVQILKESKDEKTFVWEDMFAHSNLTHVNEAKKYEGKYNRQSKYEKNGNKYRVVRKKVTSLVVTNDEVLNLDEKYPDSLSFFNNNPCISNKLSMFAHDILKGDYFTEARNRYVVQELGQKPYDKNVIWRDMFTHSNIRHINEAMKLVGKYTRQAKYEHKEEQYRIVLRCRYLFIKVDEEIIN